ncbi:Cullin-4B [Dentipellis sp. KUC8613]|nr:Cullin-4B [Dentipellis sp. KUC8613]
MSLLTLSDPSETDAFRALRPSAVDEFKSASPPRKVARLDTDSDSGSAFRSRAAAATYRTPAYPNTTGPVRVRIVGEQMDSPSRKDPGEMINKLRRCIKAILTRGFTEKTPPNEEIYTLCQYVVQWADGGASLAGHLKMELERCVGTLQKELFGDIAEGSAWLRPFVETCSWFEERVHHLQQVLTYLDRVYLRSLKEPQSIRELAFDLFTDRIFYHAGIFEKLREGVAEWIQWERNNRQPHRDRPLIADLIKHLEIHQKYPSVFESYYMELTKNYYVAEAAELLSAPDKDALKLFEHTVSRIEEEKQRAKELLPVASWTTAQEMTERALVAEQLPWLAKNALGVLMDKKDTEGLKKLYELFGRVDGIQVLLEEFKVFLQSRVKAIVIDEARDDEMVDRLLEFKQFVDTTRTDAFVNAPPASLASSSAAPAPAVVNKDFRYAQDDAFALGFKARRNKPAEMIAKHVDRLMRKGQRGASDEAFEAQLDAALALYRFTDDKDVFRTFYHRALAKRLLLERSASDDFEKAMLKKLKEQYDPDFSMGDQMFTDLALSREAMREYHGKLPKDSPAQNLNVMVLQRGVWPFSARKADITLPPSMQSQLTRFGDFYKVKHQGHKLEWDHALGTVTLKAYFKAGSKELSVSLYQGVILLLFNETPEVSFKDIKEFTQLEDAELRRTLQSLACGKKKVLRKKPAGKDVNDKDLFEFNEAFTDPRAKVHINSIQAKETVEETQRTRSSIEGERKYYLDAAIVRIMKAKKQLTYEQIKTETIEAVKKHFVPEISSIKKRIDSLVEEEYMKRDENDMNLYLYVA